MVAETLKFHLKGWTEMPHYWRQVELNNKPLNRNIFTLDVRSREFAWGYGGTGPHELARAILAGLKSIEFVQEHPQVAGDLVRDVIARVAENDAPFEGDYTFDINL